MKSAQRTVQTLAMCATLILPLFGHSEEFPLPSHSRDSVIGHVEHTRVWRGDTLLDIARAFDLGHDQIIRANPTLNRWMPRVGAEVTIPSLYVLPSAPRQGIVLNLAELRLYYYPPHQGVVYTFPVSIGDYDWQTPLGQTKVIAKHVDPPWYPPKTIREEHAADGEELPTMIPGGDPDNPLGHFALKLGIPSYLIHGTDQRRSFGIGMRVSHGCIRLYPEDIETLYAITPVGTRVTIINQPVKVGLLENTLYLEIHHPLVEDGESELNEATLDDVIKALAPFLKYNPDFDLERIDAALRLGDGIPVEITRRSEPEVRQRGFHLVNPSPER